MSVEQLDVLVEREYPHPPAAVFAAWADPEVKRSWFDLTRDPAGEWRSDCRVDGAEGFRSAPGATPAVTYDAVHRDVVPGERLVLASRITVDGRPSSFALTTVEFLVSEDGGTRLRITEHVTYLDGLERPETRRKGVEAQLRGLAEVLEGRVQSEDDGPFFHGTAAALEVGDELTPGFASHFRPDQALVHIYFTSILETAVWGAELATALRGLDERGRIYVVEPLGSFEDDPNVTDKKLPGNPTRSYRTTAPLRVVGEVTEWEGHPADVLQGMLDNLARL